MIVVLAIAVVANAALARFARDLTPRRSWGCVGCGAKRADVQTHPVPGYPRGEGYCWRCVVKLDIDREEYQTFDEIEAAR